MKRRQCRLRSTSSTEDRDRGGRRVRHEMEAVWLRLNLLMLRARMTAHARSHNSCRPVQLKRKLFCITHMHVLVLCVPRLPRLRPTVTRGCDTRLDKYWIGSGVLFMIYHALFGPGVGDMIFASACLLLEILMGFCHAGTRSRIEEFYGEAIFEV